MCHLNCSRQETVTMNKTITALTIIMASFAANASVLPETPVP
ncbi:N-acetylneuraminic acid mutarotase, partial [Escherichia coli]|nr:N-acetylneuraminic acid mutarotase [Escherichia coli]EFE7688224.1 N-acetylneuraminic acid mutarotase [Escherichia coli]EFF1856188.1 N-acetylneuraminic acid mutarotase [Escherichia coli]EFH4552338.1 N-acetylneuraminic acid mutarotase [Escherichia coli]EFN4348783.1 N-acetylneuraminic acid mutarotase [Escherichia coli]